MQAREFLQVAVELCRSKQPARIRSATGRAYYAAYHVATQLLAKCGLPSARGPGGHGQVQQRLLNSGDSALAQAGSLLADLHGRRIDADYRLEGSSAEESFAGQQAVAVAERIIAALEDCTNPKRRDGIAKSIKAAERG